MAKPTSIDPVCGMSVMDSQQLARITYDGQAYLFCSASCRQRFEADPHRYTSTDGTSRA